jgi:putative addiction module component (TIGR02574 family)
MGRPSLEEIRKLSIAERIELVEDIWDTIAEAQSDVPLTEAQRKDLDRRLDAYEADSSRGRSWSEVRDRIRDGE